MTLLHRNASSPACLPRAPRAAISRLRSATVRTSETLQRWGCQPSASCSCGHPSLTIHQIIVDCPLLSLERLRRPSLFKRWNSPVVSESSSRSLICSLFYLCCSLLNKYVLISIRKNSIYIEKQGVKYEYLSREIIGWNTFTVTLLFTRRKLYRKRRNFPRTLIFIHQNTENFRWRLAVDFKQTPALPRAISRSVLIQKWTDTNCKCNAC